jgi:hypothetical protein
MLYSHAGPIHRSNCSFDHLAGGGEERWCNYDVESPRSLQVDQDFRVFSAGILDAAIGMMDQSASFRLPCCDRHHWTYSHAFLVPYDLWRDIRFRTRVKTAAWDEARNAGCSRLTMARASPAAIAPWPNLAQSCPSAGAESMPTTRLRFGAFMTQNRPSAPRI